MDDFREIERTTRVERTHLTRANNTKSPDAMGDGHGEEQGRSDSIHVHVPLGACSCGGSSGETEQEYHFPSQAIEPISRDYRGLTPAHL